MRPPNSQLNNRIRGQPQSNTVICNNYVMEIQLWILA